MHNLYIAYECHIIEINIENHKAARRCMQIERNWKNKWINVSHMNKRIDGTITSILSTDLLYIKIVFRDE